MRRLKLPKNLHPGYFIALLAAVVIATVAHLVLASSPTLKEDLRAFFARNMLPPETPWQVTAPGLETRTVHYRRTNDTIAVRAVRVTKGTFRVVDVHNRVKKAGGHAVDVCPENGAAINASYFNMEDKTPLGLLVCDGVRTQAHDSQFTWGLFMVRHGTPTLAASTGILPDGVEQALECKPRLLINARVQDFSDQPPDIRKPSRRSAIALDAEGRIILAVTTGYISLERWAACLRDNLGCVDALALDGGPSTQLEARGRYPLSITGNADVPIFITVAPKE